MPLLLTSSNMAISTSYYKEDHRTCTTLGSVPSCYSPTLSDLGDMWKDEEDFLDLWGATPYNDTGEIFDKLDQESDALKQDLEELNSDLKRLMEKHGVWKMEFDEKYDYRANPAGAEWECSVDPSTLDIHPHSSS